MKEFFSRNEQKANRLVITICWIVTLVGYLTVFWVNSINQLHFSNYLFYLGLVLSVSADIMLEVLYFLFYKRGKLTNLLKYLVLSVITLMLFYIFALAKFSHFSEIIIANVMISILFYDVSLVFFAFTINLATFYSLVLLGKIDLVLNFSTYLYFILFFFLFTILVSYLNKLINLLTTLKKHEIELVEKNLEIKVGYDSLCAEREKVETLNKELLENNKRLEEAYDELSIKQQEVIALNQGLGESNSRLEKALEDLNAQKEEVTALNEELISTNDILQAANDQLNVKQQEVIALNQVLSESNENLEKANLELGVQQEEMSALNQQLIASNDTLKSAYDEINAKQQEVIALNQSLTETNSKLETAYNELRQAEIQLIQSEKMASLGQLSAGIAHEINTPMGSISCNIDISKNLIETIRSKVPDSEYPEVHKFLQKLGELNQINIMACQRIVKIVRSLRIFSRLDDQDWFQETDLSKDIDNSLSLLGSKIRDRVEIIKNYSEMPPVKCFGSQINQVIMNLLVNALDAIHDSGKIWISTYREDEWACISIKDNGVGIKSDHIDKIFNPGFTTKGVGVGTGLGLAIVYSIIEKHHGKIDVISEYGKGCELVVKIPFGSDSN